MSASNWGECPQCRANAEKVFKDKVAEVASSYGKVSIKDFETLKSAMPTHPDGNESLREDYWLGLDRSGKFYVIYSCYCKECELSYEYKFEESKSVLRGASQ